MCIVTHMIDGSWCHVILLLFQSTFYELLRNWSVEGINILYFTFISHYCGYCCEAANVLSVSDGIRRYYSLICSRPPAVETCNL